MVSCFIGLGSNLNEPIHQLDLAVEYLQQIPSSILIKVSGYYGNKPMGPADQPDYVNAVIQLDSELSPHELLSHLQHIERESGRVRKQERWGPRTLDLDILLYGDICLNETDLQIPHYGLTERVFVVLPLLEIAPNLVIPQPQGRPAEPLSRYAGTFNTDELEVLKPAYE